MADIVAGRELTGYPSIDKPWLKYYTEEQVQIKIPECKAYEYFLDSNMETPSRVAMIYFDRKITYGMMIDEIDRTAKAFAHIGVKKGDIVAVIAATIPETIYCFYGLNRIGAISNMIDPRTSTDGIKEYINEVHAKTVVTFDVIYKKVRAAICDTSTERILIISPADSLSFFKKTLYKVFRSVRIRERDINIKWSSFIKNGKNETIQDSIYERDECCVIVHTGGTTGTPKGVMLSNDNINAAAQQILVSPLPLKPEDVFLNIMPPFIAYGTVLGIHTVAVGSLTSVIIPKFEPAEFDQLIMKYKPQCLMGVPTHFDVLLKSEILRDIDFSFLKVVFVGGDKIKEDDEDKINSFLSDHNCRIKVSKGYSLTEASATATFASELCNKKGSAGSPLAKTTIACFGDSLEDEKVYEQLGNIYISSPTIMLGYYGKEAETKGIIKTDKEGNRWLCTGDIGFIDKDGQLFVQGRVKRMIIRYDGFKIFPSELEKVICSHKDVDQCCVVKLKDSVHSQGDLPAVFVVLNKDSDRESVLTEIIETCNRDLPEYYQPAKWIIVTSLPLTPIGKVNYVSLENSIARDMC